MVDYKIVKHCRLCKKRFVVEKSEARINFCKECQLRLNKPDEESDKLDKK